MSATVVTLSIIGPSAKLDPCAAIAAGVLRSLRIPWVSSQLKVGSPLHYHVGLIVLCNAGCLAVFFPPTIKQQYWSEPGARETAGELAIHRQTKICRVMSVPSPDPAIPPSSAYAPPRSLLRLQTSGRYLIYLISTSRRPEHKPLHCCRLPADMIRPERFAMAMSGGARRNEPQLISRHIISRSTCSTHRL